MVNPICPLYPTYWRNDIKPEYQTRDERGLQPEAVLVSVNGAPLHYFEHGSISTLGQINLGTGMLNTLVRDNAKYLERSAILARFVGVNLEKYMGLVLQIDWWSPPDILSSLEKELLAEK